jgi:alpha-D-ribose 1-methylphosphonate 5-phosphate C-P lyase
MIKECPDCGIEYSYGRNICHICGGTKIFFGIIFKDDRTGHKWNCANSAECVDILIEQPEIFELTIEVFPEK